MKTKILMSFFLLLLIVGCNTSFITKLNISDFFTNNSNLTAKAVIAIEFPEDNEIEIVSLLKENFKGANNFRKDTLDYAYRLKFNYNVEIIKKSQVENLENSELFTFVYEKTSESSLKLGVLMNKVKFDALNDKISEQFFFGNIKLKNLKFDIELNNDLSDDVEILIKSSYVNGNPIPIEEKFTMKKSDIMEIALSTILKETLLTKDVCYFCEIQK